MSYLTGLKYCTLLAVLCLGTSNNGFAQFFHHAQVGDVSLSGKSIILNRGMVEGMKPGQRARFYRDESRMDFIGVGEVIKVNDAYSFWYFRDLPDELRPKPAQKVFFTIEDEIMQGRRPLKIVQKNSVNARDRAPNPDDVSVPPEFIQKGDEHIAGEAAVKTKATVDHDARTLETTEWSGGDIPIISEDYPGELESVRPAEAATLKDSTDLREFDKELIATSVTEGAVEKARDAKKRGSDGAVVGRARGEGTMPDSIPNEFDAYQDQLLAQKKLASETRARVKKNGELWSAGLTDSELRRTLVESGVIEERERRRKAAANLASHHVNVRYTTALAPKTTDIDPNHNGNNFGLAFGYEYMLEHATESLANWSVEGIIERGISYQDVGGSGINGRIAWGALGMQVHWYPYYKPTAIRRFIPFLGIGIKRGNGDLESGLLQQSYEVQMLGTDLHAGLRFRFSAGDEVDKSAPIGMGFFVMMSLEQNRFNTTSTLQDDIDSVYEVSEQRYGFGISAFF